MKHSEACVDLVKRAEDEAGFLAGRCSKLTAYKCPAGVWTIGWGHTGPDVHPGMEVSSERANELLEADLSVFARAVSAAAHVPLEQHQFDALVSFAFNCKGWPGSTLIRLVNAGELEAAALEFPKWVHADGRKLGGLVRRREAERKLFASGPTLPHTDFAA